MGVELRGFDVPAILVGLPAAERRSFHFHTIDNRAGGEYSERDMRGVEPMMGNRGVRNVDAGEAVHEGGWPERRLTGQARIDEQRAITPRDAVGGRQLHAQVMRVLAIDERQASVGRFAGLE